MDDQFNGRTDDDLFADDFEPVEQTYVEPAPAPTTAPEAEPVPSAPATTVPKPEQPSTRSKPGSLSQSRHNVHKNRSPSKPATATSSTKAAEPTQASSATSNTSPTNGTPQPVATASAAPTNAPKGPSAATTGPNTAGPNRHLSGANPRTKLSAAQLDQKMADMRIANAERTRKFQEATLDEKSHDLALKKGEEEARKRRAEEAERKKRNDEDRKKLEDERQRNRERKLKSQGLWDQQKMLTDEPEKRNFRSAQGGVRGERRGGLGGSRFADQDESRDQSSQSARDANSGEGRGRGRGRGRGAARGDRGARSAFNQGTERANNGNVPNKSVDSPPKPEDFPSLPPQPKVDTADKGPAIKSTDLPFLPPSLNSPLIGQWDDEMAALDAQREEQTQRDAHPA
ncbi:hypothetical protein PFICI_14861 [Pestalotiopsis fici W106-1]|uniref:Uncharacterized protein n=1 Tax=Pestalotiopsis fici (strain W106-1 / CGMCC3.15140) TaxID=1229662 RepID=W3WKD0_PESFW|nr:uncharacterized protein PFICI_14861 [Pestalotiopsis fici W106-1]ETS73256.1 hypothetical protein PFICI_14861 [Pestalotiopsis fici W106-1]